MYSDLEHMLCGQTLYKINYYYYYYYSRLIAEEFSSTMSQDQIPNGQFQPYCTGSYVYSSDFGHGVQPLLQQRQVVDATQQLLPYYTEPCGSYQDYQPGQQTAYHGSQPFVSAEYGGQTHMLVNGTYTQGMERGRGRGKRRPGRSYQTSRHAYNQPRIHEANFFSTQDNWYPQHYQNQMAMHDNNAYDRTANNPITSGLAKHASGSRGGRGKRHPKQTYHKLSYSGQNYLPSESFTAGEEDRYDSVHNAFDDGIAYDHQASQNVRQKRNFYAEPDQQSTKEINTSNGGQKTTPNRYNDLKQDGQKKMPKGRKGFSDRFGHHFSVVTSEEDDETQRGTMVNSENIVLVRLRFGLYSKWS